MFNKKCRGCARKVDRRFNYCPHCGTPLKAGGEEEMGMLGASDAGQLQDELKLPFGVEKIMGGLVKQLEKQLGSMDIDDKTGMPKGFKIQIARGPVGQRVVRNNSVPRNVVNIVSKEESERRAKLERVNAASSVRRLGDVIIYEIDAPGIQRKENVVVTELETGVEIRAYSKDKCYVKVIPLKVEILGMRIERERILVEFKG